MHCFMAQRMQTEVQKHRDLPSTSQLFFKSVFQKEQIVKMIRQTQHRKHQCSEFNKSRAKIPLDEKLSVKRKKVCNVLGKIMKLIATNWTPTYTHWHFRSFQTNKLHTTHKNLDQVHLKRNLTILLCNISITLLPIHLH